MIGEESLSLPKQRKDFMELNINRISTHPGGCIERGDRGKGHFTATVFGDAWCVIYNVE